MVATCQVLACLSSCGALVALSAGTTEAATPSAKLRSISSPPKARSRQGAKLTVSGRLTNRTAQARKARVTITLRRARRAARSRSAPRRRAASSRAARRATSCRSSCRRRWPTAPTTCAPARGSARRRRTAATPRAAQGCEGRVPAPPKPGHSPPDADGADARAARRSRVAGATARSSTCSPSPGAGRRRASRPGGAEGHRQGRRLQGDRRAPTRRCSPSRSSKRFRAVVLLGDIGSPLSAAQQAAFEAYYKDGGGLLARRLGDRDRAELAAS